MHNIPVTHQLLKITFGIRKHLLGRKYRSERMFENELGKLDILANQDTCNGDCDLETPHKRCRECTARSTINAVGELLRNALLEIGKQGA